MHIIILLLTNLIISMLCDHSLCFFPVCGTKEHKCCLNVILSYTWRGVFYQVLFATTDLRLPYQSQTIFPSRLLMSNYKYQKLGLSFKCHFLIGKQQQILWIKKQLNSLKTSENKLHTIAINFFVLILLFPKSQKTQRKILGITCTSMLVLQL